MTGIFKGIEALLETILFPIKFVGFIIKELIQFGELILATITTLTTNIATMPQMILNYAILSVSVIVICRLLGRSTK